MEFAKDQLIRRVDFFERTVGCPLFFLLNAGKTISDFFCATFVSMIERLWILNHI